MGIKTCWFVGYLMPYSSLKNLPTTRGLRRNSSQQNVTNTDSLKNLPTTRGLRLQSLFKMMPKLSPLKNLPTTWGLRQVCMRLKAFNHSSEKPPHHSGIIQR